ncbi:MAG: hypothetical protein HY815_27060 [Candidatus Riflebacteria bacterium]|nr:hypothetical protein [Candidatus Riflebacteria bacterium]
MRCIRLKKRGDRLEIVRWPGASPEVAHHRTWAPPSPETDGFRGAAGGPGRGGRLRNLCIAVAALSMLAGLLEVRRYLGPPAGSALSVPGRGGVTEAVELSTVRPRLLNLPAIDAAPAGPSARSTSTALSAGPTPSTTGRTLPRTPDAEAEGALLEMACENAPLESVLESLEQRLEVKIARSAPLEGTITIHHPDKVTPDEALRILEAALSLKRYALVRLSEKSYRVESTGDE